MGVQPPLELAAPLVCLLADQQLGLSRSGNLSQVTPGSSAADALQWDSMMTPAARTFVVVASGGLDLQRLVQLDCACSQARTWSGGACTCDGMCVGPVMLRAVCIVASLPEVAQCL